MNEQQERLLSFAEQKLIEKESIRRAALHAQPARKGTAWVRVLLPIAACLIVLCSVVLTIPTARAEIFKWFGFRSPAEYLATDPEQRTQVPVLDELILPSVKDPSDSECVIAEAPNASETHNRLLFVTDEAIWQQIAEAFAVDIGETLYDGEYLYVSVALHGLTALPDMTRYTGASITQTRVPTEMLPEYFERGLVPKEYADGMMTLWDDSAGEYSLRLADGFELYLDDAELLYDPEVIAFMQELYECYGEILYTDAIREEIGEKVIAWLNGRTVHGVIKYLASSGYGYINGEQRSIRNLGQYLTEHADENGILTGTLLYRTRIPRSDPEQILLEAEIGTLRVDMLAYNRIPKQKIVAGTDAVLGSQTVIMSRSEWVETPNGTLVGAVTNYELDLNGVSLHPFGDLSLDGLGIRDLSILLKMPKEWTAEQCSDFLQSLLFYTEVNGTRYGTEYRYSSISGNTCTLTLRVPNMPFDVIDTLETFSVVPYHMYRTAMCIEGETGETTVPLPLNEQVIEPETGENVFYAGATLKLEDGMLTFSKQP